LSILFTSVETFHHQVGHSTRSPWLTLELTSVLYGTPTKKQLSRKPGSARSSPLEPVSSFWPGLDRATPHCRIAPFQGPNCPAVDFVSTSAANHPQDKGAAESANASNSAYRNQGGRHIIHTLSLRLVALDPLLDHHHNEPRAAWKAASRPSYRY
jgi:hypothetical protein